MASPFPKTIYYCNLIILFFCFLNTNFAFSQVYSSNPEIHNFDPNTFVSVNEIFNEFKGLQKFDNGQDAQGEEFSNYLKLTRHMFGYTLIAKNLDNTRQIPAEKKSALDLSIDLLNLDAQFKQRLQNEVFVEIDGHRLWIPIQNNLYEIWEKNVANNDSVLIYTRIIGGYNTDPENSWLLVMTAFHESLQAVLWNEGIESLNAGNDIIGEKYLKKLIELFPEDAEAHASLAYYYTEKGLNQSGSKKKESFAKADSLFHKAEQINPKYGFQYFQQAILKFHQQRYVKSWDLIEKAKENGHTNIEKEFLEQLNSKMPFKEYKQLNQ